MTEERANGMGVPWLEEISGIWGRAARAVNSHDAPCAG
jgi:hypothetical protein